MNLHIFESKDAMGQAAAKAGAAAYRNHTKAANGEGALIVATGASQFETLDHLTREDLPWPLITGFHIDEYAGIEITHRASFCQYLWQRFVSKLPLPMRNFHFIRSAEDPQKECDRLRSLHAENEVAVAFVGVGENAHLGFNDPPADFDTQSSSLVVELDEQCRQQQVGEGWFDSLAEVPPTAITMSVHQIMKSKTIICTVPDERKAIALRGTLEGPVTPDVPASILQTHPDCHFFVDRAAASLLKQD
tara:strand:- start:397 stop:1140 length:744 start_codon:yes stop_codon:yes gene_type:complete